MDRTKQSGFTLVEMSIIVLILGLITGAFFTFLKQKREQDAYKITVERQQRIATALSEFAQREGRLPCAGHPNPSGSISLGDPRINSTCTGISGRTGIVPFRALGLSIDDARDGFGNPFTYVVDEKAYDPENTGSSTKVHMNCLVPNVWVDAGDNKNRTKAVFCCQAATSNLNVQFEDDDGHKTSVITPQDSFTLATQDYLYNSVTPDGAPHNVAYIAYVLISHGANGEKAYIFGKNARRDPININSNEDENADGDIDFVIKAKSTAEGDDYFDDIILWRTQQRVISETNNDTCARP